MGAAAARKNFWGPRGFPQMVRHNGTTFSSATAATLLLCGQSFAADTSRPQAGTALEQRWRYQVTLYGWATALDGEIGIRGLPTANVSVSALDAIEHLDGALSGSILATDGTWLLFADLMWAKVSADATVGPASGSVDFEQEQTLFTALAGHSLPLNFPGLDLTATAGLRYQHYSASLSIDPALIPVSISREGSKGWADPIVGLALHYDINERWFINAMADVGGFGVSSDFTAHGFASVGYNWTEKISTAIGYRALYTDYDDDGFVYDATQHGVFTSIAFHF